MVSDHSDKTACIADSLMPRTPGVSVIYKGNKRRRQRQLQDEGAGDDDKQNEEDENGGCRGVACAYWICHTDHPFYGSLVLPEQLMHKALSVLGPT